MEELKVGWILRRPFETQLLNYMATPLGFGHSGLVIDVKQDKVLVYHMNISERDEKLYGKPVIVTLDEFSPTNDHWVVDQKQVDGNELFQKAGKSQECDPETRYSIASNNCEHIIYLLRDGEKRSPQIEKAISIGALGIAMYKN